MPNSSPTLMDERGFLQFCQNLCPKLDFIGKALWTTTWAIDTPDQGFNLSRELTTPQGMSIRLEFYETKQRISVRGYGQSTTFAVNRDLMAIATQIHTNVIKPGHATWVQQVRSKAESDRRSKIQREAAQRLADILGIELTKWDEARANDSFTVRTNTTPSGKSRAKLDASVSYHATEVTIQQLRLPIDLAAIVFQTIAAYITEPEEEWLKDKYYNRKKPKPKD